MAEKRIGEPMTDEKKDAEAITRAEYRRLLNAQDKDKGYRNGRFQQRIRPYGDYLYYQDREKFEVNYQEYLSGNT
jgi:hypothetical protein